MLDHLVKIMLVEDEKMSAVLKYMRVQTPWANIREKYENWENTFKLDHFKFISFLDIQKLGDVFYFKGKDLGKCRGEFIYFLKNHQEFYNDDIAVVFVRMCEAREVCNTERAEQGKLPIPFVNWIPEYGGAVVDSRSRNQSERDWHARNGVPFALDGVVPQKKGRSKRRSQDVSDEEEDE